MGAKIAKLLLGLVVLFWIVFIGWGMLKTYLKVGPDASIPETIEKIKETVQQKTSGEQAPESPETQGKDGQPLAPAETILPQARTLRLKVAPKFIDVLPVMGTVKGETEVELRFEINGVIEKIFFREGEKIKKGDLIAILNSRDAELKYVYAQSKFHSAQAGYNSVLKQLEIHKKLYEAGAIIKSKMEQIELEVESARYQLETARSELQIAENEMKKTKIYATKDGVMGPRDAEEGEFVTSQDKVGSLFEIKNVFVEVGVVERDIEKVKIGQKAKIYVDAYPTIPFQGFVEYIFPIVEGKSRTLTVKLKVKNDEGLLLPGMFSRADLSIVELDNALMVPSSALINVNEAFQLLVIPAASIQGNPDEGQIGVVQTRSVSVGYFTSDYAQILSGAQENDLVIIEVSGDIQDNGQVKIVSTEELSF
ncbi:MAG TPA: efflux RND transporter periplasmic adaptor subunit [Candidatus Omnitrophota bacterium]|nr:efflux RND transporter periplasmic adaptor subunit [Candidatus Omnitrophota bacterium]